MLTKYDCIFFSPHLDDAILSCGGQIAKFTSVGKRVLVTTVFTDGQDKLVSIEAQKYLRESGFSNTDSMFKSRRNEDRLACRELVADHLHLPFIDSIFRLSTKGNHPEPQFRDFSEIFVKKGHGVDVDLEKKIEGMLLSIISTFGDKNTKLYFPSAIGGHIDHWLVYNIGLRVDGANTFFWEDYPYSQYLSWRKKFEVEGQSSGFLLEDVSEYVTKKNLAILRYKSQISSLFRRKPLYLSSFEKYYKFQTTQTQHKKVRLLFVNDELEGGAKNANDHIFSEFLKNRNWMCDFYTQVSPITASPLSRTKLLFWRIGNYYYYTDRIMGIHDIILTSSILFLFAFRLHRLLKRQKMIRVMYLCHSDNYVDNGPPITKMSFFESVARRLHLWFANRISQWAIRLPDIILTPSEFYKSHLMTKFQLSVDKIIVVPGGVDPSFEPGGKSKKTTILYSGRLDEGKGIDLLIKSLRHISNPNKLELVVMSPCVTEPHQEYFQLLKQLMSRGRSNKHGARFLNPKNQQEIISSYQRATCVVLPSRMENLPLCLLESLASGTIFIGSNTGAIPSLLSQIDSNLILVNLSPESIARSIDYVLNLTSEQKKKIVDKGIKLAHRYTWSRAGQTIFSYF